MNTVDPHTVLNSLTTAIGGGLLLTVLARRLKLPSIVLLLFGGIALGPQGFGLVQPQSLEGFLPVIVSLAVGLILFEGGLTLDLRGYTKGSSAIARLLTIGVITTWLGTAGAVWAIFKVSFSFALLVGSMVIVTGPTVIGPLLKRIKVESRLHNILHWEGVLIDAIGVFIATLCFEWLSEHNGQAVVTKFGLRTLSGLVLGAAGGFAIVWILRRRWIPENLLNAFALAAAVLVFGITDAVISEAGLLAVTVAGFIVGWKHHPGELKAIRHFKAEITDLLIGMLFILLAARLQFDQFREFGWRGVGLLAVILFVVRPCNVLLSTWGNQLRWREKLFLSWVAPRGIVAASLASLFAIELGGRSSENARFLETFVYSVIIVTVVLQGFSAGWLARLLRVKRPEPTGWMIVNADAFGRQLAHFIKNEAKLDVLLLDTNARLISEARAEGLPASCEDALNVDFSEDRAEFQKMGHLLALTDNTELNELLCARWTELFGRDHVHRWSAARTEAPASVSTHGALAFPRMARPSVIASELLDGQASLHIIPAQSPKLDGLPLLAVLGGRIVPLNDSEITPAPVEKDLLLVLERSGSFLVRSLAAGGVFDLRATNLTELYQQIIEIVVQRHPAVSKEQAMAEMLQALVPAQLGHGVAIPHLYSPQLNHRVCVLARLRAGLRVPDEDEPLRLVFFLVSPAGDPEGHLATLAEIARFCGKPSHRQALLAFTSPEEAHRFIHTYSEV